MLREPTALVQTARHTQAAWSGANPLDFSARPWRGQEFLPPAAHSIRNRYRPLFQAAGAESTYARQVSNAADDLVHGYCDLPGRPGRRGSPLHDDAGFFSRLRYALQLMLPCVAGNALRARGVGDNQDCMILNAVSGSEQYWHEGFVHLTLTSRRHESI